LQGEAIGLESRVLAIANFFDAHLLPQPDREGLTPDALRAALAAAAGKALDPTLVERALANFEALLSVRAKARALAK
jgi:HD-GYP domain-containing protein (c-di-GMP phosphodiesterase class II)